MTLDCGTTTVPTLRRWTLILDCMVYSSLCLSFIMVDANDASTSAKFLVKFLTHESNAELSIPLRIICNCAYAWVEPLSVRRYDLGRKFFRTVTNADSCLHDLLLQRRDSIYSLDSHDIIAYPIPRTRTNKYRFLSTLPWLNTNNLKYKHICITLCALFC